MPRRAMVAVVSLLLLGAAGGAVVAEVSADRAGQGRVTTLLMDLRHDVNGLTDGADPIPHVRWDAYRRLPEPRMLNRTGAIREDGRPDVGFLPQVFTPVVVWAYNRETDRDIAIAEWTPEGWSETRFLTHDRQLDEVAPRVFVDRNAGLHVVWAVAGADPHVVYMHRERNEPWRAPIRVTPPGEIAHRPSVANVSGTLIVAYEREVTIDGRPANGIVVRRLRHLAGEDGDLTSSFDVNRVFPVPRFGDLEPILHVRGGRLWLDWKHTEAHLGWTVFQDGAWSDVRLYPWTDPSWIGLENAREGVEHLLLTPVRPEPF